MIGENTLMHTKVPYVPYKLYYKYFFAETVMLQIFHVFLGRAENVKANNILPSSKYRYRKKNFWQNFNRTFWPRSKIVFFFSPEIWQLSLGTDGLADELLERSFSDRQD